MSGRVRKPDGFEWRDRRSDRLGKSTEWTCADALFAAQERMEPQAPRSVIVIWLTQDGVMNWTAAGTSAEIDASIMRAMVDRVANR